MTRLVTSEHFRRQRWKQKGQENQYLQLLLLDYLAVNRQGRFCRPFVTGTRVAEIDLTALWPKLV